MTETLSDPSPSASIPDPRVIIDDRETHRADSTGAAPTARSASRKPTARDALMNPDRATVQRQSQSPRSDTTVREYTREREEEHTPPAAPAGAARTGLVIQFQPDASEQTGAGSRMLASPRSHAAVVQDTHIEREEHTPAGEARTVQTITHQAFETAASQGMGERGKTDVVRAPPAVAPARDPSQTMGVRGRASFWLAVRQWAASQGLPFSTACHRLMTEALAAYARAAMPPPEQLTHEGKPWRVLIRERRNRLTSR